jgi:meiotically up-regulated gene 157 (Mug157) protein
MLVAEPIGTNSLSLSLPLWDAGIHKHAVVDHPTHGKIYAYEVRSPAPIAVLLSCLISEIVNATHTTHNTRLYRRTGEDCTT